MNKNEGIKPGLNDEEFKVLLSSKKEKEVIEKFVPGLHYDVVEMSATYKQTVNLENYENLVFEKTIKIRTAGLKMNIV